ncbi:MAG: DNA polymerase III subunit gamma and tau, partial [Micrococcales bacterium]
MATALYRRYRPESFAELIGQQQVTAPLMTALRTDRVNHAYLFSGPRGCGKTTSARILARCLNCAEGPTDTPCGKCPSCVELSRDGAGSLDVIEIDAASHNGVDDARDLRERAIYAPARDRYKIFILDEAHMVTSQGFNALLKIVEEPPAHVKFIFATTEPEKVISTIRSRTHHYPFRLVPPAQLLEYLQQLCESESVEVEAGVLALVVRAGGGSVRDSLSLLDQLIAGSDGGKVTYDTAVALLGYTHSTLLNQVVDAFATRDGAAVFEAVDKVIQTGQDPRRFVEDLLEHFRNLIVVVAANDSAKSVLHGIPADEIEKMAAQAYAFGLNDLTHAASVISESLSAMTGATSPRLHLELMCAKVLVPAADRSEVGSLARIDRLERRMGVEQQQPNAKVADEPAVVISKAPEPVKVAASIPVAQTATSTEINFAALEAAWPKIVAEVSSISKPAWVLVSQLQPVALEGDVLTLQFAASQDVEAFKNSRGAPDTLRGAIRTVLGATVKFKPSVGEVKPVVTSPIAVVEPEPEPVVEPEVEPVAEVAEPEQPVTKQNLVHEGATFGEAVLR